MSRGKTTPISKKYKLIKDEREKNRTIKKEEFSEGEK